MSSAPLSGGAAKKASLLRTSVALLPLQALFRGGEAVMPLLLVAWFGRTAETDLYYLLAAYFVFAAALVTGAFQDSAVVPVLIEVEAQSPEELPLVVRALFGHTLAVGAAVALATGALAAVLAAFTSADRDLALELTAILSLGVLATSARAVLVGLLNARGRFAAHPVASGAGTALTLASIFLGKAALGVRVIPLASVLGECVSAGLLAIAFRGATGMALTPTLARPEPLRRIFRLVRLEVTGSLITRINPVVDQAMSRLAGVVGGGTILLNAANVAQLPTSVLQATLFPVFLTRLSQEARDPAELLRTTRRTAAVTTAILAAGAAALALTREPVCRLLFLHGVMDEAGVTGIAATLPWALLGVAPFGALLLFARAHVALQNSRIMPSMGVLNAGCNAALNLLFVRQLGVAGLALSTSVTYLIVAIVFWIRLRRAVRAA